ALEDEPPSRDVLLDPGETSAMAGAKRAVALAAAEAGHFGPEVAAAAWASALPARSRPFVGDPGGQGRAEPLAAAFPCLALAGNKRRLQTVGDLLSALSARETVDARRENRRLRPTYSKSDWGVCAGPAATTATTSATAATTAAAATHGNGGSSNSGNSRQGQQQVGAAAAAAQQRQQQHQGGRAA
ncbi:hypothetical protein MNEG_13072, partial [Monoraphidium neglectum]